MKRPVYLDNHATTAIDPLVLEAMLPYFTNEFGNAASVGHIYGWRAEAAVEKARSEVAELIGAKANEIIFTSGATESNNAALKGLICDDDRNELITSAIEHSSIIDTGNALKDSGRNVSFIKPNRQGLIQPNSLTAEFNKNTALVSLMFANNEIGTINDISTLAQLTHEQNALFHCDIVQAVGKFSIDVHQLNIDFASLSAHKIYGPKGVGALFVKRSLQNKLKPLLHGGKHEQGIRSGTLNVPGIVGFGKACTILKTEMASENARIFQLRNRLLKMLTDALPNLQVNGCLQQRLSGNINVSFDNVDGEELFLAIQPSLAISRGSACATNSTKMSHVLSNLNLSSSLAQATFRIGIGRFNTEAEIDFAAKIIIEETLRLTL